MSRRSELVNQISALPAEGQSELFDTALFSDNMDALEIILEAVEVEPESLRVAFYQAATSGNKKAAKALAANPNTDVNWINKNNYGMTSAMRAAMNHHGDIVDVIRERKDFDPNVVIEDTDFLGVPFQKTLISQVFGYKTKDAIKEPKEGWERRLLNDQRIDWDIQAALIIKAQTSQKLHEIKSNELDARMKSRKDVEQQVAPVRDALGLPKPDYM